MTKHARRELALLLSGEPDLAQDRIERQILELVEVFAAQDHSGSSAEYTIGVLSRLLRFEPLTPLTGADDEWVLVAEGLWQNARCGRVFRDAAGQCWDAEGVVFREPSGACFTSRASHEPVTFPYVPTTRYEDVPAPGGPVVTHVSQVGGDHYHSDYQHWDWVADTGLPYLEGCATKYLSRWRVKGGTEDLRKALSYVEKILRRWRPGDVPAGRRPNYSAHATTRFLSATRMEVRERSIVAQIDCWLHPEDLEEVARKIGELIELAEDGAAR